MTRPVLLLCLVVFGNTFSVGAFPVLLPDIGRSLLIDDFALGALAAAFGFARMSADLPAGLLITHHLRRALVVGVLTVSAGILCLASGGPYALLVLGRLLGGAGHALVMLCGIIGVVRHAPHASHGFSLNAYDMTGMLGMLCGMVLAGFLPRHWPWNTTLLVASLPQFATLLVLPTLLRALPADDATGRPLFSRGMDEMDARPRGPSRVAAAAFAAGVLLAVAWAAVGQFILPLRASREFGLERNGVAILLAIPQFVDVLMLLPLGALADRRSRAGVLGIVLLVLAVGVCAVVFGPLAVVVAGCAMFGVGLAAWMLPIALLNRDAAPRRVAWRTALYRMGVDAGIFLGPLLAGLLADRSLLWVLGVITSAALIIVSVMLLRADARGARRATAGSRQ